MNNIHPKVDQSFPDNSIEKISPEEMTTLVNRATIDTYTVPNSNFYDVLQKYKKRVFKIKQ